MQTVMETEMMGDDRELEVMKVKGIQGSKTQHVVIDLIIARVSFASRQLNAFRQPSNTVEGTGLCFQGFRQHLRVCGVSTLSPSPRRIFFSFFFPKLRFMHLVTHSLKP